MNKCRIYGINCPHALASLDSFLPCFATQEDHSVWVKKFLITPKEKLEEVKCRVVKNAIKELEVEEV